MSASDDQPKPGPSESTRSESTPTLGTTPSHRLSQLTVMVGLFVTFGGLYGYALQVPTQPTMLASIVPWLAVGFLTTWIGGILGGNSMVAPPPQVRPALRGQPVIAGIGTVAGALSAAVVILRIGPWTVSDPGVPSELTLAAVAGVIVWVGGLLIGRSMRRFVLSKRRRAQR